MMHFEDPLVSRLQSSLQRVLPDEATESEHMQALLAAAAPLAAQRAAVEHKADATDLRNMARDYPARSCVEIYIKLVLLHLYDDTADIDKLKQEFRFSMCDSRWLEALERYLEVYHRASHPHQAPYVRYRQLSDFVFEDFPDTMKVGVLGDWGTGSELAMQVLDRLLARGPDLIIHLGDVYYAGEASEYQRKLVAPLKQRAVKADGSPIPVFNLCGNHDMYSGGAPFYAATASLNANTPRQQDASYFCLRTRNRKWQILGADTGLHDHDPFTVLSGLTHLDPAEVEWHADKVRELAGEGGRSIFMSHHQPFSAFIPMGSMGRKKPSDFYVNPRLLADFEAIRAGGAVPLWLWGHEHNLGIYQPFRGIGRGRCAGHSAVPVLAAQSDPYQQRQASKLDLDLALIGAPRGRWGMHLASEFRAWRQLKKRDPEFPVPKLVQGPGGDLRLPQERPTTSDGDQLPSMYEHGFTFMTFGAGPGGEGVRVDYHGRDGVQPLWSELL